MAYGCRISSSGRSTCSCGSGHFRVDLTNQSGASDEALLSNQVRHRPVHSVAGVCSSRGYCDGDAVNLRRLAKRQMRLAASGCLHNWVTLRSAEMDVWLRKWPRGLRPPRMSKWARCVMARVRTARRQERNADALYDWMVKAGMGGRPYTERRFNQRTGEMGDEPRTSA